MSSTGKKYRKYAKRDKLLAKSLPGAVIRLSRVPSSLGDDIFAVVDAFQESINLLKEMWEWQKGCQELLPDGVAERIGAILVRSGLEVD